MKKILLIVFCFIVSLSFGKVKISGINTILVIIEEKENNNFIIEKSPISDGIFNAMWEKEEFIFFDMKIDSSIPVKGSYLDVKPYINVAKSSGADSIFLIKINYVTNYEKDGYRIKLDEVSYNLYSLKSLNSIISGAKKININKYVKKEAKDQTLKGIGYKFLNELYD